jgi:putative DNA primase/helicase
MNLDAHTTEVLQGIRDELTNGSTNGRRPRFVVPQVAGKIAAKIPPAKGGGRLYAYTDGRYNPNGAEIYQSEIQHVLGDDWKASKSAEILTFLEHSAPAIWDEPPVDRIAVRNGILDVTDGTLAPHDPEFRSPVQLPVVFDPSADCPQFERFLGDVLDPELALVVYEAFAYAATTSNALQRAFMFLGAGGAGKSTLLSVLIAFLGRDNVSNVPLHRLEDRFGPASLFGKLANVFADLDSAALRSSSVFKSITGGDRISAERKFGDPFEFTPYAKLFFSANEVPPTADNTSAYFRRWQVVPFERTFHEDEMDRALFSKLTTPAELSGILNRSLEVLPDLLARGSFSPSSASERAGEAFRTDSDSVAGFIAEALQVDPDARAVQSTVFPAYRDWCEESNRRPLGKQKFNRRLRELLPAVYEGKVGPGRYWIGFELEGGEL